VEPAQILSDRERLDGIYSGILPISRPRRTRPKLDIPLLPHPLATAFVALLDANARDPLGRVANLDFCMSIFLRLAWLALRADQPQSPGSHTLARPTKRHLLENIDEIIEGNPRADVLAVIGALRAKPVRAEALDLIAELELTEHACGPLETHAPQLECLVDRFAALLAGSYPQR
jgi:hypothetical protein